MISSTKNKQVIQDGASAIGGITSLTGDVTGTGPGATATTLANSGVSAGTKGSATKIPVVTVDAKGRVTVLTDVTVGQAPITGSSSSTGTVSNLAISGANIFYLDNATDLTLTGLVAGVDGQQVTLVSRGAGNVFLTHQATSTAANQLFNQITSGLTPLVANKGNATYEYDASISRWRLIAHKMGGFISSAFAAGDFTANGSMTWTVAAGDVTFDRYTIIDTMLFWQFRYSTTTVGGTPNTELYKSYPSGYSSTGFDQLNYGVDNGTVTTIWMTNQAGNTGATFFKQAGGNWSASTDNTYIRGNVAIRVT